MAKKKQKAPKFISFEEVEKSEPPKFIPLGDVEEPSDDLSEEEKAGMALRSFLEGQTIGLSEPVVSGAKAGYRYLTEDVPFGEAYEADVAQRKAEKAKYPGITTASEVAGAVAPTPLGLVGKVFGGGVKAIRAAGKAAQAKGLIKPIAESGKVMRGAKTIGKAGAEAAAGGLAAETTRQAALAAGGFKEEFSPQEIAESAASGAAFGAGLSAAGGAAKEGARIAKKLGKQTLSAYFGGVPVEHINKYLADPEKYRRAKSLSEIKSMIDQKASLISDDLANKQLKFSEAEKAYKGLEMQLKDALKDRRQLANQAVREAKEAIKESKARAILELAPNVAEDIQAVGRRAGKMSEASKEILVNQNVKMPKSEIQAALRSRLDEEKIFGELPEKVDSSNRQLQRFIDNMDDEVDGVSLKRFIRYLQREKAKYSKGGGEPDESAQSFIKGFTRDINESLKGKSDDYREIMEKVAKDTDLSKRLLKQMGTEQAVVSTLKAAESPLAVRQRGLLKELQAADGRDYLAEVGRRAAPAEKGLRAAEAEKALARRAKPQLRGTAAEQRLREAAGQYESAARGAEPIRPLLKPGQTESLIRRAALGGDDKNIEVRQMLKAFGKRKFADVPDEDFIRMIDDMRANELLMQPRGKGSSFPNIWISAMGGLVGTATGGVPGALAGAGVGGGIGKAIDAYGPQVTKQILDMSLKFQGLPPIKAIRELRVPDSVKDELFKDLIIAQEIISRPPEEPVEEMEPQAAMTPEVLPPEGVPMVPNVPPQAPSPQMVQQLAQLQQTDPARYRMLVESVIQSQPQPMMPPAV